MGSDMEARFAQKRKLDSAFSLLDSASSASPSSISGTPAQPPAKKPRLSLYTSLFKKETPHLTAILTKIHRRSASAPGPIPTNKDAEAEYFPSSLPSFLSRLATYKLSTYTLSKPSPVDAARCGWRNEGGKDRVVCAICGAAFIVTINGEKGLVEKHKDGCPWRSRQCDEDVYRVALKTPRETVKDLLHEAARLTAMLDGIEVKHPLTAAQARMVQDKVLAMYTPPPPESESISAAPTALAKPSESAILAALFGWVVAPPLPPPPPPPSRRSTSISRPATPSRSSTPLPSASRAATPAPSTPRRAPSVSRVPSSSFVSPSRLTTTNKAPNDMIYCPLCLRRVGLWDRRPPPPIPTNGHNHPDTSSSPPPSPQKKDPRPLNVLLEHRSFCPYVVKETPLPSPTSSTSITSTPGKVEGWKAILSMVARWKDPSSLPAHLSGATSGRPGEGEQGEGQGGEEDRIKKLIEGVKAKGGRDLMKYVRSVLP